jgi:hypothetical protein
MAVPNNLHSAPSGSKKVLPVVLPLGFTGVFAKWQQSLV